MRARPELRALTGLRFVAALHVLVFHVLFTFTRAAVLLRVAPASPLRALLASGYVGVNFFFVLSGFVLVYAYVEDGRMTTSAGRFWRARFARIYPMYVVGLALAVPLFVLGSLDNRARPDVVLTEAAKELGLSAALVQAWIPAHALDLNGPAWSLSVEAFFYALFPLLVRVLGRLGTVGLFGVGVVAWFSALAPPLVHGAPSGVMARMTDVDLVLLYDPLVRLPDFVVGVVAGLLFLRSASPWKSAPIVATATSLLAVAILGASERIPFALLHNGLMAPLWALLLFALAKGSADDDRRGIASDPLVRGGRASYALYVLHKPLYSWMARALHVGLLPSNTIIAAYIAGSVTLSVVAWRFVEEPLRRVLADGKKAR
jgi:peptidoglycan/LPS O-acetylase OafA/YrhL